MITASRHSSRPALLLRRAAAFVTEPILEFLFPAFCLVCGKRVEGKEHPVCSNCLAQLPRSSRPLLPMAEYHSKLPPPFFLDVSIAAFEYSETLQTLIHEFKYRDFPAIAQPLGQVLAEVCAARPVFQNVDYIVPVPLHPGRFRERGFNQAELIGLELGKRCGKPVAVKMLRRIRYTQQQALCDGAARQENVRDAFQLGKTSNLENRTIAMVDDVMTTGSTMNECARLLRAGGVESVIALSLARID